MTVIRPNSVSGINSITAQADEIKVFKSNGTQGGLIIGGANLNATTGISTILALNVTGNVSIAGTLTYQDVTNVDSIGIITARAGVNVSAGQLDVGSNIKIGNAGVITATSFSGSGANLTGISQVGGSTGVDFNDNVKIRLGTGNDYEIYHDGSNAVHRVTGDGDLKLLVEEKNFIVQGTGGHQILKGIDNGAVELYHDNVLRYQSYSGGVKISSDANIGRLVLADTSGNFAYQIAGYDAGSAGSGGRLVLQDANGGVVVDSRASGGNMFIYNTVKLTGNGTADNLKLVFGAGDDAELYFDGTDMNIKATTNVQNVNIWTEGVKKYQFTDGMLRPLSNNSYDLGQSSLRWRNIYTNDLNLSNEGSTNSVDNTWGNYTIQEGESDLFLINNRNGKKYKFNLTEVS